MSDFETALRLPVFGLNRTEKAAFMTAALRRLTQKHYEACPLYRNMLDGLGVCPAEISDYRDVPFLPVSLFKEMTLKSIPDTDVFKTLTSSGTTGQAVSRIYLDRAGVANQQKALVGIVSAFTGASRLPMLIIDSPSVIKNRAMFSARGAGILGFSIFGADRTYALNDDMEIDFPALEAFLERHQGRKILLFGFTFMIWQHFYRELLKSGKTIDLSNGILIHGGGWKKLIREAVSADEFKKRLTDVCGLSDVHDYYGMVEQTGCIYMQCECGHLHASVFSDVIIRRPADFSVAKTGEKGIVQVVSVLPESYPGHSLLTEDEGVLCGEDDCPCGRKGKYFEILGRLKNAEIRGCSDTYADKFQ